MPALNRSVAAQSHSHVGKRLTLYEERDAHTVAQNDSLDHPSVQGLDLAVHRGGDMATQKRPVRKNLRLSQTKIDKAKKILGTKTETETIEQALDLVAFRKEVVAGLEKFAGSGLVRDPDSARA
jgi:hypothetical protein